MLTKVCLVRYLAGSTPSSPLPQEWKGDILVACGLDLAWQYHNGWCLGFINRSVTMHGRLHQVLYSMSSTSSITPSLHHFIHQSPLLQVNGWLVFELSCWSLTGFEPHVVTMEMELETMKVKGEYWVGFGDGYRMGGRGRRERSRNLAGITHIDSLEPTTAGWLAYSLLIWSSLQMSLNVFWVSCSKMPSVPTYEGHLDRTTVGWGEGRQGGKREGKEKKREGWEEEKKGGGFYKHLATETNRWGETHGSQLSKPSGSTGTGWCACSGWTGDGTEQLRAGMMMGTLHLPICSRSSMYFFHSSWRGRYSSYLREGTRHTCVF